MALITQTAIKNLSNNVVANYDANGDGNGINSQPLQVSVNGALITTNRIEISQLEATFSHQALNVLHANVGAEIESMYTQLYNNMVGSYAYANNLNITIMADVATPAIYNIYMTCTLSNL